ncbi:MAG: hypothetical protein R6V73_12975 [Anaerolineales bacterium]
MSLRLGGMQDEPTLARVWPLMATQLFGHSRMLDTVFAVRVQDQNAV